MNISDTLPDKGHEKERLKNGNPHEHSTTGITQEKRSLKPTQNNQKVLGIQDF